jgi:peptidoglycan hydrolase-like protein with peptidoglycan-binding domain
MIYERGLAGQADERTAYGLYRQAAAGGSERAIARLAVLEGRVAPSADNAAAGQKLTRAEIAETQRLLAQLAFDPGPADGQAGPATRAAIRNYQQVAGLPVDGQPSAALLAHLRQVVGMMAQP